MKNKMKLMLGVFSLILVSIMHLTLAQNSHTTQEIDNLRNLLTGPSCQIACFMSIEPGVTTLSELDAILAANQVVPTDTTSEFSNGVTGLYYWFPDPNESLLRQDGSQIRTSIGYSVVTQVDLKTNIPVSLILETFGAPITLAEMPDGRIQMLYPQLGLMFSVPAYLDTANADRVIIAETDSEAINAINDVPDDPVDQPCPTYGEPPCIAPTRLPNQAPTVNIIGGFTFTETLFEGFPNPVMINVNNEFYTDDPDGDALTYEWSIIYPSSRAGVVYSGTEDVISLNIGPPHGDYCNPMILELTATDPYGASASDTTTVSFVPLHTTGQCVPEF